MPIAVRHFLTHERKIDRCFYLAQRMTGSHPFLQIHLGITKELLLSLLCSHHDDIMGTLS